MLQALKTQSGPQTVDPEFLKMMAQPAGPSSHHVSPGSGGSSTTDEAVVYQPARMLHTMGVVAAAGVVAGEMLGSCVLNQLSNISHGIAMPSCSSAHTHFLLFKCRDAWYCWRNVI
jgi:hypothetical protein